MHHLPGGEPYPEAAIQTSDGVKAADLVWDTWERLEDEEARNTDLFDHAPQICIEVMSKSNPMSQMQEKMRLYFEAGAIEVWLCDQKGKMYFYRADGLLEKSLLSPEFPSVVS